MKILHVVPSYLPAYRYGGPILSVHTLNKWLVRAGADVTVYTTDADGRENLNVPLGVPVNRDGVRVFYFKRSFPRRWFYSAAMRQALAARVREFDIVHITSVFLAASTLGAHYAKKFEKPYIISPRGSLMKEPLSMRSSFKKRFYISLIERGNLAGAEAVHFTTEKERKEYVEAEFPMEGSVIIPNAYEKIDEEKEDIGIDVRRRMKIPRDAPIVLSLGRINWKKGFNTLIPAFRRVKEKIPQAVLVVAGDDEGGYKSEVEHLISKEGMRIGDDVKFTDCMVFGEEKAALMGTATAFVLPSYSENFGMAPIESMAHGTAVVVTRNVGIAPDVERSGAGIAVGEKTEANERIFDFANAIISVLKAESVKKQMGEKGRAFVAKTYSPERVAAQFLEFYNQVANKT